MKAAIFKKEVSEEGCKISWDRYMCVCVGVGVGVWVWIRKKTW